MAGLIGLGVHYRESVRDSSAKLSTVKANLTERLQSINNEMSSVTEERDRLNASLSEITEELDKLQSLSKQNHDSAQRSAAELSSIKVNLTELLQAREKTCPAGWKMFSHNCYFLSDKSGSWDKGREDCKGKGADLLVINTLKSR
ncbi:C-type lectin domain family 4 member G-like [Micropterus salmoides]|uniref:C-type lectin domain family 4 member G-like n=1 Tax=Micropterus salmoides TaxID=27706 RepID=UPI0018EB840C|nr:C-type lectin domain family 4 member G-like [Micropterus salmoides]